MRTSSVNKKKEADMFKTGFDNDKYLKVQSEKIMEDAYKD